MKRRNVSSVSKPVAIRPTLVANHLPGSIDIEITKEYLIYEDIVKLSISRQLSPATIYQLVRNTLAHIDNFLQLNLDSNYLTDILKFRNQWLVIIRFFRKVTEMHTVENIFHSFTQFFFLLQADVQNICLSELEELMNYPSKYKEPSTKLLAKKVRNLIPHKKHLIDIPVARLIIENNYHNTQLKEGLGSMKLTASSTLIYINQTLNLGLEKDFIDKPEKNLNMWNSIFNDYILLADLYRSGSIFYLYCKYFCTMDAKIQERHIDELIGINRISSLQNTDGIKQYA